MHTLTLTTQDDQAYQQLMQLIQSIGNIRILDDNTSSKSQTLDSDAIDFGQYTVTAFHDVDAVAYQRSIRDEW